MERPDAKKKKSTRRRQINTQGERTRSALDKTGECFRQRYGGNLPNLWSRKAALIFISEGNVAGGGKKKEERGERELKKEHVQHSKPRGICKWSTGKRALAKQKRG